MRRLNKLKIIGLLSLLLIFIGVIFLYFNKDSFIISEIMGNSSTISKVVFKPDMINIKNFNQYYYSNNDKFISTIYESAGFTNEYYDKGYERQSIEVYDSNNIFLTSFSEDDVFIVNRKYTGLIFVLKVYMRNDSNNKKIEKTVELEINREPIYELTIKDMVKYAETLVGKNFNHLKEEFSKYETKNYEGNWNSWFVWNVYHKYGIMKKNSWINSLSANGHASNLSYPLGWSTYEGYYGYSEGNSIDEKDLNFVPVTGDLILIKFDEKNNDNYRVGIVKKITDSYIETIEGNINGVVGIKKYAIINKKYIGRTYDIEDKNNDKDQILGYFSPQNYF